MYSLSPDTAHIHKTDKDATKGSVPSMTSEHGQPGCACGPCGCLVRHERGDSDCDYFNSACPVHGQPAPANAEAVAPSDDAVSGADYERLRERAHREWQSLKGCEIDTFAEISLANLLREVAAAESAKWQAMVEALVEKWRGAAQELTDTDSDDHERVIKLAVEDRTLRDNADELQALANLQGASGAG